MPVEAPVPSRATESLSRLASTTPFFKEYISRSTAQSALKHPFEIATEGGRVLVQRQSESTKGVSATLYSFRSEKTFRALTLNSEFTYTPHIRNLKFWKSVITREAPTVGGELGDHHVFEYEAGRLSDPEDRTLSNDTNRTVIVVEDQRDSDPKLLAIEQHGTLTNPNRDSQKLNLSTYVSLEDDKPVFALNFVLSSRHRRKDIRVNVRKYFAFDQESGVYKSVDAVGKLEEDMPEFLSPATTKDNRRITFANDNARRVFKLTPNEFSPEQVDQMLSNIIEGRVATTGIWNPLEALPELRRASKPQKAV